MAFSGSGAGKGAVGGAMVGGALGGPVGAGVGAVGGALLGGFGGGGGTAPSWNNRYNLPGFQSQYDRYGSMASNRAGRVAPRIAESGFRPDQRALVGLLQQQAAGHGAGQALVRAQAQQMADRSAAQQMGAAQGVAGGGAMAARNAALGMGQVQSAVGEQAAIGGLMAQQSAIGQLGGTLQGARGQDLARGQANAQMVLQNRQINDQAVLEALRQRLSASELQQRGGLAYNANLAGYNQAQAGKPTMGDQLIGAGIGAGTMAMMGGRSGAQPQYRSTDWGSTAFNPYNY